MAFVNKKMVCSQCGRVGVIVFELYRWLELVEVRYLCPRCYHSETIFKKEAKDGEKTEKDN